MQKPKIELRKVKVLKRLSEETPCYAADVWVDGEFFCHASNRGQGGCDQQRPPTGANIASFNVCLRALEERVKATFEPIVCHGTSIAVTFELACHLLLAEAEAEKALKRDLARKILFAKADGKVYQIVLPPNRRAAMIEELKRKPGVAKVLNELPFADALAIYKAA